MTISRTALTAAASTLLLATGCGERPSVVMSDSKTADVLADLRVASAYMNLHYSEFGSDSARRAFRDAVLASHSVDAARLDTTMSWYARHPDKYIKLTEEVTRRVERIQGESFPADMLANATDGKDLWPYFSLVQLSELSPADGLVFEIEHPELEAGEQLEFIARPLKTLQMNVLLGVNYSDGARHYIYRSVGTGQKINIRLQTDSLKDVERIYGSLTVMNRRELPLLVDSISLLHHPLVSENYYIINQQRWLDVPGAKRKAREKQLAAPTEKGDSTAVRVDTEMPEASTPPQPRTAPRQQLDERMTPGSTIPPSAGAPVRPAKATKKRL